MNRDPEQHPGNEEQVESEFAAQQQYPFRVEACTAQNPAPLYISMPPPPPPPLNFYSFNQPICSHTTQPSYYEHFNRHHYNRHENYSTVSWTAHASHATPNFQQQGQMPQLMPQLQMQIAPPSPPDREPLIIQEIPSNEQFGLRNESQLQVFDDREDTSSSTDTANEREGYEYPIGRRILRSDTRRAEIRGQGQEQRIHNQNFARETKSISLKKKTHPKKFYKKRK